MDLQVVHADLAQWPQIGRRDRLRFARQPDGEIDDGALSRLDTPAKTNDEQKLDQHRPRTAR